MEESKILRINELAKKSKKENLTEEERVEQMFLRKEYIAEFRKSLEVNLESILVVNENGDKVPLKKKTQM